MGKPVTLAQYYLKAGVKEPPAVSQQILLGKDPMRHQVRGLYKALLNSRWGFYDQAGCGKTFPAQAWALYYIGFGCKTLAVMPPNLIVQFERALYENFPGSQERVTVATVPMGPAAREKQYAKWDSEGWPDLLCMSYQMFLKEHLHYLRVGYEALLADEAHVLKSEGSLTHKSVDKFLGCKLGDKALLLMTGTPNHNTLEDCYGLIRLTSPGVYASKDHFDRLHGVFVRQKVPVVRRGIRRMRQVFKLIGFKNKALLSKNLFMNASRVTRDQVYPMDKPRLQTVPVVLHPPHLALYRKLVKQRFLDLGATIITATTAQSLRQHCLRIVANPHLFSEKTLSNAVVETVDTLLDSIGNQAEEKCVLFCHYNATVEALAKHYAKRNPAVLYGKTGGGAQKQVDKFVKDSSCRLFIANPKSGGVGVDKLQNVCSHMIFVEPMAVPGDFEQAVFRLDRPGQKHVVQIYLLQVEGTLYPQLLASMQRKASDILSVNRDSASLLELFLGGRKAA